MTGLSPQIGLKDGHVTLTLNGIPAEKIGDVAADDLVAQTIVRIQNYALFALGLISYASEIQERLDFQGQLFEAWLEGLGAQDESAADLAAVHVSGSQAKTASAPNETERDSRSPGGLEVAACVPNRDEDAESPVVAEHDRSRANSRPRPVETASDASSSARRSDDTRGYVLGGVGVAGLLTGTVTLFAGIHQNEVGDANCDDSVRLCNQKGFDANQSARTLGTVSTVSLLIGAAGVGAGAYLLLSADPGGSETAVRAQCDRGGASASLVHRF